MVFISFRDEFIFKIFFFFIEFYYRIFVICREDRVLSFYLKGDLIK